MEFCGLGNESSSVCCWKSLSALQKDQSTVFCIIDDTIASETQPSSQAAHPIEAASNHMSHLKGHMDFGHQAIGVWLACRELLLNYAIILYDKSQSKIELVRSIWDALSVPPNPGYLLCNSLWNTSILAFNVTYALSVLRGQRYPALFQRDTNTGRISSRVVFCSTFTIVAKRGYRSVCWMWGRGSFRHFHKFAHL